MRVWYEHHELGCNKYIRIRVKDYIYFYSLSEYKLITKRLLI